MRSLTDIKADGVMVYLSRDDYFKQTGITPSAHSDVREDQFWVMPLAAHQHMVEVTIPNFDVNGGGGDFNSKVPFVTIEISGNQASTPNFPDFSAPGAEHVNPLGVFPIPLDPKKMLPGEFVGHTIAGYVIESPGDASATPAGQADTLGMILANTEAILEKLKKAGL